MNDTELDFLKKLLLSPSPSGYEAPIQKVVRAFAEEFADEVTTDWHGNVVAVINPEGSPRIMLDGHCDQIGLLIKHIDKDGFLRVSPIGGWDAQVLLGQNLQVWTKKGPITGVIARKAIHLLTPEERKKVTEIKNLWIDIGVSNEEEARALVEIGDPVTLELGYRELQGNLATAPGMDDRVGVWTIMMAAKQIAAANPQAAIYAVSAVQEEIGLRGTITSAYSINPDIGIAVDVTHATDCPDIDVNEHGDVKIDAGPVVFRGPNVNPILFEQLQQISEKQNIPIQVMGISRPASNDGNAIQVTRGGVATGIIGIANRYMHSPVEVVSLKDLKDAANLIAQFCLGVNEETDFTP
ncbi:Endoglucanase [hydrothermal vent metagenome]|uniref:Endoglucanase n=1 Tax=hydrothermal vent metagenome TaxID=652676 RepID=A0A3B1DU25_9ZZZZ